MFILFIKMDVFIYFFDKLLKWMLLANMRVITLSRYIERLM